VQQPLKLPLGNGRSAVDDSSADGGSIPPSSTSDLLRRSPRSASGRVALPIIRFPCKLYGMTSIGQAHHGGPLVGESRPGLAIGGGILAGLVTLALVGAVLNLLGGGGESAGDGQPRPGDVIRPSALAVGDCFEPGPTLAASIILRDCEVAHPGQVTGRVSHPGSADDYPGTDGLSLSVGQQCDRQADDFLGVPVLTTTLAAHHLVPSMEDWAVGETDITCYVAPFDGTQMTGSAQDRGTDFPRSRQVPVSRLIVGDCFVPADGLASYELNSNSAVDLASCDDSHNGVFFGRGMLDSAVAGAAFPGDQEIGRLTSDRCAELFEDTYGVSADGFNYRYWRPNEQSWELGDRNILCAVLDADPLSGRFEPARYQPFFELEAAVCFDLGPEETDKTLGLDDQVIAVDCTGSHAGQMIGAGLLELEDTEPYPGEQEVKDLAGGRCEALFEEFVGISPFDSELVNFPFWYPNQVGWEQGDRRYACAFLDEVPRVGTLEGAGI
jgi:hypothetical protein